MQYTKEYEIRGHEIDGNYILRPELLVRYFQNTFACECADLGIAAYDIQPEGKTWALIDFIIDISGDLPRWRDSVRVEIVTKNLSAARLLTDFQILHNSALLASGTSSWFILDEKRRRPLPLGFVSDKFGTYRGRYYDGKPEKLKSNESGTQIGRYIVTARDTDFNGHLNNVRYIEWALASLPADRFSAQKLERLQVNYLKEVFFGNVLSVYEHVQGNIREFRLEKQSDEGKTEVCRIKSVWG